MILIKNAIIKIKRKVISILKRNFVFTENLTSLQNIEKIKKFIHNMQPVSTELNLIRVGSDNDGGYLIPNDLQGLKYLISPGVSNNSSFELFFAQKNVKCILVDASVDKPNIEHKNFVFIKKFLSNEIKDNFVNIDYLISEFTSGNDDIILQMDIEGWEWDVLKDISLETLSRFRIMTIEFHRFIRIFKDENEFSSVVNIFEKLSKAFYIVHIHNNNCCKRIKVDELYFSDLVEITFIRKDRVKNIYGYSTIPHKLDQKNVNKKDFTLKLS